MLMSRRTILGGMLGCVGLVLGASAAHAERYPKEMENDLIAVCEAIQDNNRLALKRAVKKSRVSYVNLYRGLVCNGEDMLTFARSHNAAETSKFLVRRVRAESTMLTVKN